MKKSAIFISIILVLLVIVSWIAQFTNVANKNNQYSIKINQAERYMNEGLFQKAMDALDDALSINENKDARSAWVEAGIRAYEDGVISAKDLSKAISSACDLYPDETIYWEKLITHYLSTNSYTGAYEALIDSKKANATSDVLKNLSNTILYSFTVSRKTFSEFTRAPSGYFTVYDEKGWGVVDPAGERTIDCEYTYISPYNIDSEAVYISGKGVRLINKDAVVEYIISEDISKAYSYSNGFLPFCDKNGQWKYLNCNTGEVMLGSYEKVSSFVDGTAAVYKDNKWTLINANNEAICNTSFDDIKLHSNGDYAFDNLMIASVGGKYGIFDAKGNRVCDFTAADMDAYYGGDIAYKDSSGKWGYITKEGKASITPEYDESRSFSAGLAAVRIGENWGYIDQVGTVVIDCQFFDASYFSSEGSTLVSNQEGKYVVLKRRFK